MLQKTDEKLIDDFARQRSARSTRFGSRFSSILVKRSAFRDRVPIRYRPALFFETIYSIGSGAYLSFMFLTPFALKSVVGGTAMHLTIFGAMVGGSSLLSPLVTYLGGRISM